MMEKVNLEIIMTEYVIIDSGWYPNTIDDCIDTIVKLREFKLEISQCPLHERIHLCNETEYKRGVVDGYNEMRDKIDEFIKSCCYEYENSKVVLQCRREVVPSTGDQRIEPLKNSEEMSEWLKTELTEKITNCKLLAEELWDPSVGNGTLADIDEAVKLFRHANILRGVLDLKKPEDTNE